MLAWRSGSPSRKGSPLQAGEGGRREGAVVAKLVKRRGSDTPHGPPLGTTSGNGSNWGAEHGQGRSPYSFQRDGLRRIITDTHFAL